nr:fimbrial protein [Bacteroides intestinalis]
MKKQIFFLSALLALGFSGCSDKENIETGNSEEIRVAVTFDIGTNTRAVNGLFLGQVTLYVFNEETEAYVSTQETQIEGGTITFPGKGSYIVEAIANEKNNLKGLKDYEDFKSRTTVYDNAKEGCLQMRGVQTAKVTNVTQNPSMYFQMRRLVARINIVNEVTDFKLTEARLSGAMSASHFYTDESMGYWTASETQEMTVSSFAENPENDTYKSVFYVYECPNAQCNLSLDVKGTIDGIEHAVPTLKTVDFIGKYAPLRRNVQYNVTLNEVDGAIVATLEVTDWEEGEETGGAVVSPDANSIEVEISATAGTSAYATAFPEECAVNDLSVYLFGAEGTLEKAYTNLLTEEWTPENVDEGKKIILKNVPTTGGKTLYIIANAEQATSLTEVSENTTKDDFKALLAVNATGNLKCPLLMFKEVEITAEGWTDNVAQVSAVLERAAARIDLRVNDESGFTPEKVTLVGANSSSYVIASTAASGTPINLEGTVEASNNEEAGYKLYPQLFYLYSTGSTEGMYLLLEGTQKSGDKTADAIYKKPLSEMEFSKIEHNTCYTITINDVDGVPIVAGGNIDGEVVED